YSPTPSGRGIPRPREDQQALPFGGGVPWSRYPSTAPSTQELPAKYVPCPSWSDVSRTPDARSLASCLVPPIGVAGSRSLPMTRIGVAPTASVLPFGVRPAPGQVRQLS